MNARDLRGRLLLAAVIGFVCATSAKAEPVTHDPWAEVPALPTACYSDEDPAEAKLDAALAAIQERHYQQNDVNAKIREEMQNVDPMELARRMQENMMKDPEGAAKYMEQVQSLGAQIQTETTATLGKEDPLRAESEALLEKYDAALDAAYAPGNARWKALREKLGLAPDAFSPGESGVPDWAWTEWHAILREWDRAYVTTCPEWWNTDGHVHQYMKRYRDYLVKERVPYHEKLDQASTANFQMVNAANAEYKPVATFEAAEDYIKRAKQLFGHRLPAPRCPAGKCQ